MPRCVILYGGSPTIDSSLEEDLALVRLVDAGDDVEQRRLARAVRADHTHDLVLVDVEVEPVDHQQPSE